MAEQAAREQAALIEQAELESLAVSTIISAAAQPVLEPLVLGRPPEQEEEKEEEPDLSASLQEAFTKLEDVNPFETGDFNVTNIVNLFKDQSTDPSQEFLDKGEVADEFAQLVADAFKRAITTGDPNDIKGVFSTLGQVASQITIDTGESPVEFLEQIIQSEFPLTRLAQLEGRLFQEIDIGNLITQLFNVDLQILQQRNIGADEISAIRVQFKEDLDNLEVNIATEGETFIFGQNTLRMLQDYINSHVENDQLRQVLLGDIQRVIAENRQKLGIQLGEAPPIITPITASLVSVLRQSTVKAIGTVIGEQLRIIDIKQAKLDERGKGRKGRLQAAQRDRILVAVNDVNSFIMRNDIRNPRTGQLLTIATEETRPVTAVQVSAVSAVPSARRFRPVSNEDLVAQLRNLSTTLARPTQSFEHVPRRIRDPQTGLSREGIIKDLIEMEQRMNIRRLADLPPKRQLVSSISKRAKFPNAEIRRGPRRLRSVPDMPAHIFGSEIREIRIRKEITLAELAKIANMIAMENGSLEDIHERPLLDVQKGVTTVQEIVNAIMLVQHMNAGNDFSVLFVPSNPVGGMFLDGALSAIHMNRMLLNPVGGDIFSSIFNTVGNIVKTVASVPLQLAGTVFGGDIRSSLAKPLLVDRARKVDSAQHGGALTQEMFNQGELQPEPFISQGGANQIFRIQPFPFGGRIDNTGFIDQSQINPKFAWGDVPIISLTSFG